MAVSTTSAQESESSSVEALERVEEHLSAAAAAKKCHRCGCFQDAVAALEASPIASPLAGTLRRAQATFEERRYDCLGCEVCWPADALNVAAEVAELPVGAACPTDAVEPRDGWPPFPGDYRALRFAAPVAVCTLHTRPLVDELARIAPEGLSIVGSLQTENLGIERIVENVVSNPNIRVVLLCGQDTAGRVGHMPGQSLIALVDSGTDDRRRIVGAAGKRPVLRNVEAAVVAHFRRQVQVLDHRGLTEAAAVAEQVTIAAATARGPIDDAPALGRSVRVLQAERPDRLVLDPAGYVVIVPDRRRRLLVAEHYENRGVLGTVVEGADPVYVMATLLRQGLITRPDHAAYLGRELTLARRALDDGSPYVQDQAPDSGLATEPDQPAPEPDAPSCDCGPSCGDSR